MTMPDLRLSLQFSDASHRALLPRHRVARWIRHALAVDGEITVRIVGGNSTAVTARRTTPPMC